MKKETIETIKLRAKGIKTYYDIEDIEIGWLDKAKNSVSLHVALVRLRS